MPSFFPLHPPGFLPQRMRHGHRQGVRPPPRAPMILEKGLPGRCQKCQKAMGRFPASMRASRSGRVRARRRRVPGLELRSLPGFLSKSVLLTLIDSLFLSPPRFTNSGSSGSAWRRARSTALPMSGTPTLPDLKSASGISNPGNPLPLLEGMHCRPHPQIGIVTVILRHGRLEVAIVDAAHRLGQP